MPLYFYLLDERTFAEQIRPALAASWRQRSFEPCRALCTSLLPAARSFAERYHLGPDEPVLMQVARGSPGDTGAMLSRPNLQGPGAAHSCRESMPPRSAVPPLPFDRDFWRLLAGEIFLFAAADIPQIQTAADSFCCLVAPDKYAEENTPRQAFAPIQQVHYGSRDLVFGSAIYRPDHAGWNNTRDVSRLAAYLASLHPQEWTTSDLAALRGVADDDDRAEELAFLRDWFEPLRELYQRADARKQIMICETL